MSSQQQRNSTPTPVEFRATNSSRSFELSLYVNGEHHRTVFTIERDEPRDQIARRLSLAFGEVFGFGAELGMASQKQEQAQEGDDTSPAPNVAPGHVPDPSGPMPAEASE
jgi:hypothetical protein